jgi:hypothetical protein
MSSSLIGCIMTIQSLYHYALNHSLLNVEVDDVIREYIKEHLKELQLKPVDYFTKVEYTTEDVLELFSS